MGSQLEKCPQRQKEEANKLYSESGNAIISIES